MIEARWSNGFWKHFDRESYRDVAIFYTRRDAEQKLKRAD